MSALERLGVAEIVYRAEGLGVAVPAEVSGFVCGGAAGDSPGARAWLLAHPDWERTDRGFCCVQEFEDGPGGCVCWVAVYDLEQVPVPALAGRPDPRCGPRGCATTARTGPGRRNGPRSGRRRGWMC